MSRVRLLDLGAFAAYFAVAVYLGRQSLVTGSDVALAWPAIGVAVAWMAVTGWRRWLVVDGLAIGSVSWVVSVATGMSAGVALGLAVATVVQALLFGLLISRRCPQWWGFGSEPPPGVEWLRELGVLLAAALASSVVWVVVGPVSIAVTDGVDVSVVVSWVVRSCVAIVAIFPLSLLARNAARARGPRDSPTPFGPYRGSGVEFVTLAVVSVGATWLVFGLNDDLPVPFILLATSVWAGVRFSPWVADLHALLLAAGVVTLTVLGSGPFAQISDPSAEVLAVQAYLAVVVVLTQALVVGRRESLLLHERLATSEETATAQAALMRTILDTMADGVTVTRAPGEVVLRNPAAGELVGDVQVDERGVVAVDRYGLLHADGRPLTADDSPVARALAGEQVDQLDIVAIRPGAPEGRVLQVTARPIPGSDPPIAVVVFHDVTAVRRERDELASFAGVVAHDLLNPLTVVEGWSESLLESARAGTVVPAADQAEQLDRIHRAAQRMQHLISDLLAFTTARDLRITPVRVDLLALAHDVARARADASRVSEEPAPVIRIDPSLPDVLAEPVLLRQVIDNLVGNAIKYVAPGVRPEIEVCGRVVPGSDPSMVVIEVIDNGIGIPAGQHARVFETFHRAHLDGYRGTGLGLSIVKRIAERHGGTATARDNAGRGGTTMAVTFPAADRPEPVPPTGPGGEEPSSTLSAA